jgi:hemoglobin
MCVVIGIGLVGVVGLVWAAEMPGVPQDGQLSYPVDYRNWPKFLSEVQRPDVKQVRELYVNPVGARAHHGDPFPDSTVMVMELYKAKIEGESPVKGTDGKLVKDKLAKVFVMEKNKGWGGGEADPLKNGTWVFSAFGPDGTPLAEDFNTCRACHAPLAQKDFVHRYDEYFEDRKAH